MGAENKNQKTDVEAKLTRCQSQPNKLCRGQLIFPFNWPNPAGRCSAYSTERFLSDL